ncbi:MAG TPA: nuclear transport factor 2 family protein [Micromonosporaceae bacterium]|nr:nuclear transport factor 2 family protein [Micromonosporaceae bacterium]
MVDEGTRLQLALEYCRRMNAGDVEGVLRLFADGVRYEDPVGSPPVLGREALRSHLAAVIAARVHEVPGTPVAAQDGQHVVVPVTATLDYLPLGPALAAAGMFPPPADPATARLRFRLVSLIRVGPDQLMDNVQVFWGRTDVTVLDGVAALDGASAR